MSNPGSALIFAQAGVQRLRAGWELQEPHCFVRRGSCGDDGRKSHCGLRVELSHAQPGPLLPLAHTGHHSGRKGVLKL